MHHLARRYRALRF